MISLTQGAGARGPGCPSTPDVTGPRKPRPRVTSRDGLSGRRVASTPGREGEGGQVWVSVCALTHLCPPCGRWPKDSKGDRNLPPSPSPGSRCSSPG